MWTLSGSSRFFDILISRANAGRATERRAPPSANPSVPRTGQCFRRRSARDVKNPISPFRSVKKYGGVMSQNSFQELPPVHPICASPSIRSRQPVPVDEVYDSAQIPSRERIGYPPEIAKRQKLRRTQWRHPSVLLPADQRVVTHFDAAHKAWRYDC